MAITYKKALKSIEVKTLGGTTVSVSDTATETKASAPLAEFESGKTMHIKTGENEMTYIPFHAVDSIVVTVSQSDDITKEDPYCVEAEGASDDSGDDSGN